MDYKIRIVAGTLVLNHTYYNKNHSLSEPRHNCLLYKCSFLVLQLRAILSAFIYERLGRSITQVPVPTWARRLLWALRRCRSQLGTGSQLGAEQLVRRVQTFATVRLRPRLAGIQRKGSVGRSFIDPIYVRNSL